MRHWVVFIAVFSNIEIPTRRWCPLTLFEILERIDLLCVLTLYHVKARIRVIRTRAPITAATIAATGTDDELEDDEDVCEAVDKVGLVELALDDVVVEEIFA